jgi:hypothetical protein
MDRRQLAGTALSLALVAFPARGATAQPPCRVEGTWDLVSVTVDGKDEPLAGYQQRKVVGGGRFMWLGQAARRDTLPMRTALDSMRATSMAGGAGTFTLVGNAYTEKLDYFLDPSLLGHSMRATCRTEGDRWTHSFTTPFDTVTSKAPRQQVVELWRRVP